MSQTPGCEHVSGTISAGAAFRRAVGGGRYRDFGSGYRRRDGSLEIDRQVVGYLGIPVGVEAGGD